VSMRTTDWVGAKIWRTSFCFLFCLESALAENAPVLRWPNCAPGTEGKPAQETVRVNENGGPIVSGAGGFNLTRVTARAAPFRLCADRNTLSMISICCSGDDALSTSTRPEEMAVTCSSYTRIELPSARFEIPTYSGNTNTWSPQPQEVRLPATRRSFNHVHHILENGPLQQTARNHTALFPLAVHRHRNIAVDLRRRNLEVIQRPPGSTLDVTVTLPLPADRPTLQTLLLIHLIIDLHSLVSMIVFQPSGLGTGHYCR
jgi:hypothetical protein